MTTKGLMEKEIIINSKNTSARVIGTYVTVFKSVPADTRPNWNNNSPILDHSVKYPRGFKTKKSRVK